LGSHVLQEVASPRLGSTVTRKLRQRLVLQAVGATLHARIVRRRCDGKSARQQARADLLTPFLHVRLNEILGVLF
jgi:hypothetical protein